MRDDKSNIGPARPDKNYRKADFEIKKYLAEHTVESGDSLSYIAKKYYDSGSKENWMLIYEENKKLIGDDPGLIQPGQVLNIPHLVK